MPELVDIGPSVTEPSAASVGNMSPLSLLSIIRTLWKRKTLIAITWLAASVVAGAVAYLLPSVYRSHTVILIESQRIPERFVATTVNVDLQARLNTISQRILSYDKLLEVIQKFDLYKDQRSRLVQEEIIELMRSDIEIRPVREWTNQQRRIGDSPGAFLVAYRGPAPAVVAQVANQLGNLFIDENLRAREVQAMGTSSFLDNQLDDAKRRLEQQEKILGEYKLRHGGELPEQENSLIATMTRLEAQMGSAQDAISRAEQSKMMLSSLLDTAQASEAALTRIAEQVAESRAQRGGPGATARSAAEILRDQIEVLRRQYTDQHPDVRRLQAQLAALENAAPQAAGSNGGNGAPKPQSVPDSAAPPPEMAQVILRERERVETLRAQLAGADKQIERLNAERAALQKQGEALQRRIEKLPLREQELAALKRDYEISKANYHSLYDKRFSAGLSAEMEKRQQAERFSVLDAARVPEKPIKPDRESIALLGSAAGLLLGLAAGILRESKTNALLGEWELPRSINVLGRVPMIELDPEQRARRRRARRLRLAFAVFVMLTLAAALAGAVYKGLIPL